MRFMKANVSSTWVYQCVTEFNQKQMCTLKLHVSLRAFLPINWDSYYGQQTELLCNKAAFCISWKSMPNHFKMQLLNTMFSRGTIISGKYFGKSLHTWRSYLHFKYCQRKSLQQHMALGTILREFRFSLYRKNKVKVAGGSETSAERIRRYVIGERVEGQQNKDR